MNAYRTLPRGQGLNVRSHRLAPVTDLQDIIMPTNRKRWCFYFPVLSSAILCYLWLSYHIKPVSVEGPRVSADTNATVEIKDVGRRCNNPPDQRLCGILSNWTNQLTNMRWNSLNNNKNNKRNALTFISSHGNYRESLNAHDRGFFAKLSGMSGVKTLYLNTGHDDVTGLLPERYYHSGSNNCETMLRGLYGGPFSEAYMHAQCFDNVTKTLEPYSQSQIFRSAFALGLPSGYGVYHGHKRNNQQTLTFIHIVENAVVTEAGDVYVGKTRLIPQRCMQQIQNKVGEVGGVPLHEEVFTISQFWGGGFFHAIVEDLPRLVPYIEFLKKNPNIKLHTAPAEFTEAFINLLGIETRSRLLHGTVAAKVLYQPAGTPCGRPVYFNSNLLSYSLRTALSHKPKRNSIVLIRRSQRSKRSFKYHNAILDMLQQLAAAKGLHVTVFSDEPLPSLPETGVIFNSATMVVAPHGAGLSNVLFCEPGTVVIEGLHKMSQGTNLCYRNLVTLLGMRYYGLYLNGSCAHITPQHLKPVVKFYLDKL